MKKTVFVVLAVFLTVVAFSQENKKPKMVLDSSKETHVLEASCGTCMFKMKGDGCKLAVRFKGKDYFVVGTGIDDHGDAHDQEGFCNAISKAKVQGKVEGDAFKVSYFELLKKETKQ
jgi:hypothetical protein